MCLANNDESETTNNKAQSPAWILKEKFEEEKNTNNKTTRSAVKKDDEVMYRI